MRKGVDSEDTAHCALTYYLVLSYIGMQGEKCDDEGAWCGCVRQLETRGVNSHGEKCQRERTNQTEPFHWTDKSMGRAFHSLSRTQKSIFFAKITSLLFASCHPDTALFSPVSFRSIGNCVFTKWPHQEFTLIFLFFTPAPPLSSPPTAASRLPKCGI